MSILIYALPFSSSRRFVFFVPHERVLQSAIFDNIVLASLSQLYFFFPRSCRLCVLFAARDYSFILHSAQRATSIPYDSLPLLSYSLSPSFFLFSLFRGTSSLMGSRKPLFFRHCHNKILQIRIGSFCSGL